MVEPKNKALYAEIKKRADDKFQASTSVYKSAWIVKEYKRLGGTYKGEKPTYQQGLLRWFKEKWINLNRPTEPCGRRKATNKGEYPLCRPTKRVNKQTPKLAQELTTQEIERANKEKQKVKHKKHIKF